MRDVFIVEAARTPIGKFRGALAAVRADHLGAHIINALLTRVGLSPDVVDDVIFGNVTQVGEQSANIARTALLSAGWPYTIPGMTVDRKCGSSEAAIHVAVAQIAAGHNEVVVAGGAESMSRVPMGGNRDVHGEPFGWMLSERYEMTSQGEAAERISDKWNLTRDDLDDYAMESHRRAAAAADAGYFDREIAPLSVADYAERGSDAEGLVSHDQTIRRETTREKLSTLKTAFRENGKVTAGNASQISDGAAAVLLMSADAAKRFGVKPRARIRSVAVVGSDPTLMLTGPMDSSRKAMRLARLDIGDIDLVEINEAFAPVPMVWMKELGGRYDRLNVNGGAIALGHPLGATGARLMTTLLHEMERRDVALGLQAICCAGGMATATVIERV